MSVNKPSTKPSGPPPSVTLAPQPGVPASKETDSGDAALIFVLSLGKFFASVFRMRSA